MWASARLMTTWSNLQQHKIIFSNRMKCRILGCHSEASLKKKKCHVYQPQFLQVIYKLSSNKFHKLFTIPCSYIFYITMCLTKWQKAPHCCLWTTAFQGCPFYTPITITSAVSSEQVHLWNVSNWCLDNYTAVPTVVLKCHNWCINLLVNLFFDNWLF